MGANNADFNCYHFMYSGGAGDHVVTAHHPDYTDSDVPLGALIWDKKGKVLDINVEEEHQRKGVGKAMWKFAKGVSSNSEGRIPEPEHDLKNQTKAGKAWAKAVGK